MKANKPFIDSHGNEIKRGDTLKESDYRKEVVSKYEKLGLVTKQAKSPENKQAKPKSNKGKKK
ncbi:MAG: hypothetical protein DWP95_10380 [Proteobacteria bacterium]|nr:MAG: hypothetical protein DWP95_10380 [Pseudomonadota bacterium]